MSEDMQALAAQVAGLPADQVRIALRPPLDHQSNRLYDIWARDDHWIAKEFLKSDELEDAPRREFGALTLLRDRDIAPQPVHHAPATDSLGPVVIYEYLDGAMWDRYSPTAHELGQLAGVWLTMNAVEKDDLWLSKGMERSLNDVVGQLSASIQHYAGWAAHNFPAGKTAAALCLEVMEQRVDLLPELTGQTPPLCFCRSDPRFANVIRRPDGRLGLIDWEDSGLRDPAIDLADVITHPNQEDLMSHAQWQALLEPYIAAHARRDPGLARRTHLYLGLFPMYWLTIILNRELQRIERGEQGEWIVNDLPASQRLRRYLARALVWPDPDFEARLADLSDVVFFPA